MVLCEATWLLYPWYSSRPLGIMASEQKVPWLCEHKANPLTEEEICECLDPQ